MPSPLAEQIISRNNALESKASNFRQLGQDCADYIMPRKGQITTQRSPGESQTTQLFDSTAEESNLIFGAGLLSQLVPPGEIWARYQSADKNASDAVKTWFDGESEGAMEDIHNSNFYLAIHEAFLSAGAFCTAGVYLEEGSKRFFLNFSELPFGTYTIAEDNEGMVDTVFRKWSWSARQAAQQWGEANLGPQVAKALNSANAEDADKEFTFIHAIYPRAKGEVVQGVTSGNQRPIACVYVCVEDKHVILEDGYYEMPSAVARLLRSNGEVYGRGPGTQILPEVKLVNRMEYDLLLAMEKEVNPGWIAPEDSAYRPNNQPGGVTYWDTTNPNNKPEVLKRDARIDMGEQKTEQKRDRIRRAFFVDMFQMLNRPEVLKNEKTAFQIAEMLQEKLLLFSPMFARLTQEMLNPILERVFAMRIRSGRSAPPPAELANGKYKIVYTSKIAQAIRAAQDNAVVEMLQLCSLMAPFDQSVPMVLKWRDAFKQACRNRGVSSALIRSDEDIDAMVQQMQQAQQAMEKAKLAESVTKSAQQLGPKAQEITTNAVGQFAA